MTTPRATQVSNGVLAALAEITPANGYHTDAGLRVFRARSDDLDDSARDTYPAIVAHCERDTSADRTRRQTLRTREIQIQAVTLAIEETEDGQPDVLLDYEPVLDALAEDVVRALLPLTDRGALGGLATDVEIEGGDYEPRAEGSRLISVSFTLRISYVLQYERA